MRGYPARSMQILQQKLVCTSVRSESCNKCGVASSTRNRAATLVWRAKIYPDFVRLPRLHRLPGSLQFPHRLLVWCPMNLDHFSLSQTNHLVSETKWPAKVSPEIHQQNVMTALGDWYRLHNSVTTKAGTQLNVTECPEMEECKPLGPKSSQIILLAFTIQASLTHGVNSVKIADAGRPKHLLPRCIPENCTFSDWSDWQDPTCLGALILVLSELPVSPNFPKFPVAVSCTVALSLKSLLQNISGTVRVMGSALVVRMSWKLRARHVSSMVRIPICCIASTP